MKERFLKLRQMFSYYLEQKEQPISISLSLKSKKFSDLSDDQRKQFDVGKIAEEEAEKFTITEPFRPILLKPMEYVWPTTTTDVVHHPEPDDDILKTAKKILEAAESSKTLDAPVFKPENAKIIRSFFENEKETANEQLLGAIDQDLSILLKQLHAAMKRYDHADPELKLFLGENHRMESKQALLESMLKHPNLIPSNWGGENPLSKQKSAPNVQKDVGETSRCETSFFEEKNIFKILLRKSKKLGNETSILRRNNTKKNLGKKRSILGPLNPFEKKK